MRHTLHVCSVACDDWLQTNKHLQVKREKMEEHFAREAQLQSEVMAMSQSVVQLTQTLAECKETLECCVCLERPVRFVAVPCGHHFCGHSSCYSSKMVECPTCRTQITGRTELFGACSWLAEMFDNIDAANVEAPGGGGMAVEAGTVNRQVLPGNDLDIVEKAISGAEQVACFTVPAMQDGKLIVDILINL